MSTILRLNQFAVSLIGKRNIDFDINPLGVVTPLEQSVKDSAELAAQIWHEPPPCDFGGLDPYVWYANHTESSPPPKAAKLEHQLWMLADQGRRPELRRPDSIFLAALAVFALEVMVCKGASVVKISYPRTEVNIRPFSVMPFYLIPTESAKTLAPGLLQCIHDYLTYPIDMVHGTTFLTAQKPLKEEAYTGDAIDAWSTLRKRYDPYPNIRELIGIDVDVRACAIHIVIVKLMDYLTAACCMPG